MLHDTPPVWARSKEDKRMQLIKHCMRHDTWRDVDIKQSKACVNDVIKQNTSKVLLSQ